MLYTGPYVFAGPYPFAGFFDDGPTPPVDAGPRPYPRAALRIPSGQPSPEAVQRRNAATA